MKGARFDAPYENMQFMNVKMRRPESGADPEMS